MRPIPRARTFSTPWMDRCTGCQCEGAALCNHGENCPPVRSKRRRREIPLPVLQVLVYGSSIAFVCWVVWLLWRAFA